MYMILVSTDLDEPDFISLLDTQADLFESTPDGLSKGFSSVFDRTDQVVK